MTLTWTIKPEAPREWLRETLAEVQRIFSVTPHHFSQLPSGTVFFRCRLHREHGVTYVPSRDYDHPHVLMVHLEYPDPVLVRLAQFIRARFQACSPCFEPGIHPREQEWAAEILTELSQQHDPVSP